MSLFTQNITDIRSDVFKCFRNVTRSIFNHRVYNGESNT